MYLCVSLYVSKCVFMCPYVSICVYDTHIDTHRLIFKHICVA